MPGSSLHNFELKPKLFSAEDGGEVELQEFSGEAQSRPSLVQVNQKFDTQRTPEIGQTHVSSNWSQFDVGVEGKRCLIPNKASQRITVEVISMSRIRCPVRICIVWSNNLQTSAGFSNSMKFGY